MNVERGKTSFTLEEIEALQRRLADFKDTSGKTWSDIQSQSGIPKGTLSVWVGGNYNGDNAAIAERVHKWFLHREAQETVDRDAPMIPSFQRTRTADRITAALNWAYRGKIVIVVGDPGAGKTAVLRQFAADAPNVTLATMSPTARKLTNALLTIMKAQGSTLHTGTGLSLSLRIRERVSKGKSLIIIDEAQHLSSEALDELRAIHDETGCGIVLVGNREVLTRVEGVAREAAFAQLFSRISLRLVLGEPHASDVDVLLDAWCVTKAAERTYLHELAARKGGGGLRTLTFVLEYATLLAQGEDEGERVLSHIKSAARDLSTRTAA